jgi:nucleoside triphosphate diphosphatase
MVKVREELEEVRAELNATPVDQERLEDELGDLLFAVVNLCRKANVHPALALDRANIKFSKRFSAVERVAKERGLKVGEATLEQLDAIWDEVKLRGP